MGFNFSSEYIFEYFENKNSKELSIKKNQDYIPNFFNIEHNKTNISNIHAVVGKNGTGKSTILEFISNKFDNQNNIVAVFKKDDEILIFKTRDIKINNQNMDIPCKKLDLCELYGEDGYLNEFTPIYYSIAVDTCSIQLKNEFDISTKRKLYRSGSFSKYCQNELIDQLKYLKKYYAEKDTEEKNPDIPDKIKISINYFDIDSKYKNFLEECSKASEEVRTEKDLKKSYLSDFKNSLNKDLNASFKLANSLVTIFERKDLGAPKRVRYLNNSRPPFDSKDIMMLHIIDEINGYYLEMDKKHQNILVKLGISKIHKLTDKINKLLDESDAETTALKNYDLLNHDPIRPSDVDYEGIDEILYKYYTKIFGSMNSQELENEFPNYLKNTMKELSQDISEFKNKFSKFSNINHEFSNLITVKNREAFEKIGILIYLLDELEYSQKDNMPYNFLILIAIKELTEALSKIKLIMDSYFEGYFENQLPSTNIEPRYNESPYDKYYGENQDLIKLEKKYSETRKVVDILNYAGNKRVSFSEMYDGEISKEEQKELILELYSEGIFLNLINNGRHDEKCLKTIEKILKNESNTRISELLENIMDNNKNLKDLNKYLELNNFKNELKTSKFSQSGFEILSDNSDTINRFLSFYYIYNELINIEFMNTSWNGISSGEEALLNLYSRFYTILENNSLNNQLNKNLTLLIDEGDLYKHPEWQRMFIYRLIEYLPKCFKDHTVQIILTTHSPFIVSDLPKENITFLKKDKDDEIVIGRTFASNIHELYSKSFFMQFTTGEFSKNKIQNVITELNNRDKQLGKEKLREIWYIIEEIGEPIIKNKLKKMYAEKFKTEDEAIDQEIERLEGRINDLKQRRSKNDQN